MHLVNKSLQKMYIKSLNHFLSKVFSTTNQNAKFYNNWHLRLTCATLQACMDGKIKRLIINCPPRSLKSLSVSVAFPAWVLAQMPHKKIIVASYSLTISQKHASDCRKVLLSSWFKYVFPAFGIKRGQNTKTMFATQDGGFYFATSIGGSLLGEGGDILIVDDPQLPQDVITANGREKAPKWFQSTLMSRLNDKKNGIIIVVSQRLHCDDLSARLLELNNRLPKNERWHHISFSAIATQQEKMQLFNKTYHNRNEGEVLNEKFANLDTLLAIEASIGAFAFAAQYQQNPMQVFGNLVKTEWIKYYNDLPRTTNLKFVSLDCARGINLNNDFTAIITFATDGKMHWIIDIIRKRLQYPDLKKLTCEVIAKFKPTRTLIEDSSNGAALVQDLKGLGITNIVPIRPKTDKVTRFNLALGAIEAGDLLFPSNHPSVTQLIEEICAFPLAKHDDQVDAISQYFLYFISNGIVKHGAENISKMPRIRVF